MVAHLPIGAVGRQEEAAGAGGGTEQPPRGPPRRAWPGFHQLWLQRSRASRGQRAGAVFVCLNYSSVSEMSLKKIFLG